MVEKDQDIKYLKSENLKCQNLLDEQYKASQIKEQNEIASFESMLQQLNENLKNLEDENKVNII